MGKVCIHINPLGQGMENLGIHASKIGDDLGALRSKFGRKVVRP